MGLVDYLGIDPGGTTGMSMVTVDTAKRQIIKDLPLQLKEDAFIDYLDMLVDSKKEMTVVMETFTLFSSKAVKQSGSTMPASQVEGMIRAAVRRSKGRLKLVEQSSKDNPMRAKHSGRTIPKDHRKSHCIVAYNHVFDYLLKNNLIKNRMFWV